MINLVTLDSFTFSPIGASKAATSLARIVRRPLASPLMVVAPLTSIAAAKRAIVRFLASFPSSLEKIVSYKYIVSKDLVSIKTLSLNLQKLVTYKYIPTKDLVFPKGSGMSTVRLTSTYAKYVIRFLASPLQRTTIGVSSRLKLVSDLTVLRFNAAFIKLQQIATYKYLPTRDTFILKGSGITTPKIGSTFARFIVRNFVSSITTPVIGVSAKLKYGTGVIISTFKPSSVTLEKIVSYKYLPSKDLSLSKVSSIFTTKVSTSFSKYIIKQLPAIIASPIIGATAKLKYATDVTLLRFKAIPLNLQKIVSYKYLPAKDLLSMKTTGIGTAKISTVYIKYLLMAVKSTTMVLPRISTVISKPIVKPIVSTILTGTIAVTSKIKYLEVTLPHLKTSAIKTGKVVVANVMRWNANLAQQVITVVETTTQSIIEFWS